MFNPESRLGKHTRVDHLNTVLEGDLDNLITGQVGADGGILSTLANDVGFIGLCVVC